MAQANSFSAADATQTPDARTATPADICCMTGIGAADLPAVH